MNIAILSGKGGTGKTTIATNLAATLNANYIDCDVEEPNGFIFLQPKDIQQDCVDVIYPQVNPDQCRLCGKCVTHCQFNALFKTKQEILTFEKMCHGCKACALVCPQEAISFTKRTIGYLEDGTSGASICKRGILNVGEPMAVPVIKKLLKELPEGLNLLDCPPGTSCNVVNTLYHAQGAILVTEPSAFGLHDLKLAIALVRKLGIPFGVITNKWDLQGVFIKEFLDQEQVDSFGMIPFSREAAESYAWGKMLKDNPLYQENFTQIAERMEEVFKWN